MGNIKILSNFNQNLNLINNKKVDFILNLSGQLENIDTKSVIVLNLNSQVKNLRYRHEMLNILSRNTPKNHRISFGELINVNYLIDNNKKLEVKKQLSELFKKFTSSNEDIVKYHSPNSILAIDIRSGIEKAKLNLDVIKNIINTSSFNKVRNFDNCVFVPNINYTSAYRIICVRNQVCEILKKVNTKQVKNLNFTQNLRNIENVIKPRRLDDIKKESLRLMQKCNLDFAAFDVLYDSTSEKHDFYFVNLTTDFKIPNDTTKQKIEQGLNTYIQNY